MASIVFIFPSLSVFQFVCLRYVCACVCILQIMRANICGWLCGRHHSKCWAPINSFNPHNNPLKEGFWMALLFARWKDWDPEKLVSLLRIFSISSFNSTCWQKSYSWLPKTFSYFKFKFSLDFILPLLFPGWFPSSWGWCSIMTPGEGIRPLSPSSALHWLQLRYSAPSGPQLWWMTLQASICWGGWNPIWSPATWHRLSPRLVFWPRDLFRPTCSLYLLANFQTLLKWCETVSALLRQARPGSRAGSLWRPSLCWHILLPYLHILWDISPVQKGAPESAVLSQTRGRKDIVASDLLPHIPLHNWMSWYCCPTPSTCSPKRGWKAAAVAFSGNTAVSDPLTSFFFFLVAPCGMQDLSSLTRYWTCASCSGNGGS